MKLKIFKKLRSNKKGFIVPLTLLVSFIILTISTGISVLLTKELYFSKLSRESQIAYYAADNAMMCAKMVDDQYIDPVSGLGIFPFDGLVDPNTYMQSVITSVNSDRSAHGFSGISLNSIKCATSAIFDASISGFTTLPYTRVNSVGVTENGKESTYSMKMDLGDGTFRCASVLVYKTALYRQIIARGFTSCVVGSPSRIERAVIDTSDVK